MVYTHKHPALLIMGVILLVIGATVGTGVQAGLVEYLNIKKMVWEISTLSYTFGGIALVVGIWHLVGKHVEGNLDYYLSAVAGAVFIFLIAMLVRWYLAPFVAVLSKALGPVMGDKYLHQVLGLNYVVLGIVAGIIVVNVFRVPVWAENGVRLSRLGLKTGVILLGVLYSAAELRQLGGLSIVMISFFVLGSVGLVLWMG
ncbi:MAG TPA: putative sulfate exporter family transporter, partial [Gammaproteobacteria bacterium]